MITNFIKSILVLFFVSTVFVSCKKTIDEKILPSETVVKTERTTDSQQSGSGLTHWRPSGQVKVTIKYNNVPTTFNVSGAEITMMLKDRDTQLGVAASMFSGNDGNFIHPYRIPFFDLVRYSVDFNITGVPLHVSTPRSTPYNIKYDFNTGRFSTF